MIKAERLNVDDTIARTESPTALKKRVTVQSTESLISVSPPTSTTGSFLTVNSSLDKAKVISIRIQESRETHFS